MEEDLLCARMEAIMNWQELSAGVLDVGVKMCQEFMWR